MDYSKWDKVVDSDDEEDVKQPAAATLRQSMDAEDRERRLTLQEEIGEWLLRQQHYLRKEEHEPQHRSSGLRQHSSHLSETPKMVIPYRKMNRDENKVLAMLIAVSDFEEGETNLTRHPELLDLVRHHRWLEDDPGTLELLCRIHSSVMRRCGNPGVTETSEDRKMRDRLLSGINTLAAPKRAKCTGGLLDLLTKICTPETEAAKDLRKKWQTKEFAKDALFDSLFPDLRQYSDEEKADDSMWEIWLLLILIVIIIIGVAAFIYFAGPLSAGGRNATRSLNATLTTTTTTVAQAMQGPSAAPPPGGPVKVEL